MENISYLYVLLFFFIQLHGIQEGPYQKLVPKGCTYFASSDDDQKTLATDLSENFAIALRIKCKTDKQYITMANCLRNKPKQTILQCQKLCLQALQKVNNKSIVSINFYVVVPGKSKIIDQQCKLVSYHYHIPQAENLKNIFFRKFYKKLHNPPPIKSIKMKRLSYGAYQLPKQKLSKKIKIKLENSKTIITLTTNNIRFHTIELD